GSYGLPGEGKNGPGLNGVYYDWKSNTFRSTETENQVVGSGSWDKRYAYAGIGYDLGYKGFTWVYTPSAIGRWGNYNQSFWEKGNPNRQGGMPGLHENDFIKYSLAGTSVWAGTIQTGFDVARKLQPSVSSWIKGTKVLGKTSNILGVVSVGYDFATGTANSSTLANATVLVVGSSVVFFGGVALSPWVAAGGVAYGIISIAGGDEWLNRNIDISIYINLYKPSNP
ncbi:MAG TPA: hypothetical protein VGK10_19460, partial [Prolixibacteraceae bacterium]